MDRSVAASASPVRSFLIQAVFWNLALFALIRLSWVDQRAKVLLDARPRIACFVHDSPPAWNAPSWPL